MGNNTARFRELIELSNNSYADGTSLIKEYQIKNENLAATLEKISKTVSGWFSSETFIDFLSTAVNWLAKFIGATEDADGTLTKWKNNLIFLIKIISVATVGMISYNATMKLVALYTNGLSSATTLLNIAQKANALSGGVLKAVYLGMQYVFYTLTLQTDKATIAQQRFNLATKMNPIGLVVGLIMAAVAAYVIYSKEIDKNAKKQQNLNDVRTEANKAVVEEKANLENLLKIARDEGQSRENKEAAIKRINEISPEYLKNITLETINTLEAKKAIDGYLVSLDKKAMKEAFARKRSDLSTKVLDATNDKEKSKYGGFFQGKDTNFKEIYEIEKTNIEKFKQLSNGWNSYKVNAYEDYKNAIIDAEDELKSLSDEEQKFIKKNASLYTANEDPSKIKITPPTGDDDKSGSSKNPNSTQAEIDRLKLENQAKYNDLLLKQQRQLEDDRIAAMQEGYEKEMAIEGLRYNREIEDLDRQKVHADEMAKLDEEIAKAKESKDIVKYNALLTIRKGWHDKNLALDEQIDKIKEGKLAIHNLKVATIEEKAAKDLIEKEQEIYELAKKERETNFLNELAQMNVSDVQKKKLQDEFNQKELQFDKEHLAKKIDELKQILKGGTFQGIDFSLLTPEAKEKIEKDIAFLQNAMAKIELAKNPADKSGAEKIGDAAKTAFGNVDVLGFTPEQWDSAFANLDSLEGKMAAVNMVVMGMQNAWAVFGKYQDASDNARIATLEKQTNIKKATLQKQLDHGFITQKAYNRRVESLDKELERQKAEADYKKAKREKEMSLVSAVINTAKAVTASLPNFLLAGIAAAIGAIQIATISKQPLPAKGYEQGLYGDYVKREQDGKVFNAQYGGTTKSGVVTKPTYFLTGENGPEMIIDSQAFRKMSPTVRDSLLRELRGIKGFEQGYYNKASARYETPATSTTPQSSDAQVLQMVLSVIADNTAIMKEIKESGILAIVSNKDLQSMKNLKEGIEAYTELRKKSKK